MLPVDRMRLASLVSLLLVTAATACDGGSSGPRVEPEQHLPASTTPEFTLLVSNQSFDLSQVDIRIAIDGRLAVTGDFLVESQHTWVPFDFDLTPGSHTLEVTSADVTATLTQPFDMDDRKWGVVMFWYGEGGTEPVAPSFSWNLFDEQPGFD